MKRHERVIDGVPVTTYEKVFPYANILGVEAGTTGLKGGDSGYGGRAYLKIEDLGGTDISFETMKGGTGIEIELGGDSEIETFVQALETAAHTLREQLEYSKYIQYMDRDIRRAFDITHEYYPGLYWYKHRLRNESGVAVSNELFDMAISRDLRERMGMALDGDGLYFVNADEGAFFVLQMIRAAMDKEGIDLDEDEDEDPGDSYVSIDEYTDWGL